MVDVLKCVPHLLVVMPGVGGFRKKAWVVEVGSRKTGGWVKVLEQKIYVEIGIEGCDAVVT